MKRILLSLSVLCAVGTAYAEREVFAPTILAPVATGANGKLIFAADTPFITGGNIYAPNNLAIGTTGSNVLQFFTNTLQRMQIDSAGDVYIGRGTTAAAPTAATIRATSGSGTNIAGAELLVAPGQGTGTGAGGVFRVSTAPAGTSGSSLNGLVERVRVKQGGQVRFVPLAAAPTLDVENGDVYYNSTTNKLQVRAGGAWVDLH